MAKFAELLANAPWIKQAGPITDQIDNSLRDAYFAIQELNKEEAMAAFDPITRLLQNVMGFAQQKLRGPGSPYLNKRDYDPSQMGTSRYVTTNPEDPAQSALMFNPSDMNGPQEALHFLQEFHNDLQHLSRYMAGDAWDSVLKLGQSLFAAAKGFAAWLAVAKFQ